MKVQIKEVKNKKDLKKYIKFPFELYKNDKYWTPPLFIDEYSYYNPKKNKNILQNPNVLFIALKSGIVLGRIMGLINETANNFKNESLVRWNFLDSYDDENVVHSLLEHVENWGRLHGMKHSVGPRGFTDQEPQGALVEGFEERAAISTHYNKPYLIKHIESFNYKKDVDWISYKAVIPNELPPVYQYILKKLKEKPEYKSIDFKNKKEMKPYIIPILNLLNQTYSGIYGFSPMTEDEMKCLARKYMPVLDPKFICVIKHNEKLIGFGITMPDITEGLRRARGKLFPFGLFHILKAKKFSKILQLLLVGIDEAHRGKGIFVLFADKLKNTVLNHKMEWIDSHLQLEDNKNIRVWLEKLNGTVYRRHRAFIKEL